MKTVFVVTRPENGWDSVVYVLDALSKSNQEKLEQLGYVVTEKSIDTEEYLDLE